MGRKSSNDKGFVALHHSPSHSVVSASLALLRRGHKEAFLSELGLSKNGFPYGCLGNVGDVGRAGILPTVR